MNTLNISNIKTQLDVPQGALTEITYTTENGEASLYELYTTTVASLVDSRISEHEDIHSYQESYLGYDPETATFFSGYDAWLTNDRDVPCFNVWCFKLVDGAPKIIGAMKGNRMMYGQDGHLKELQSTFPNLVDLRLD